MVFIFPPLYSSGHAARHNQFQLAPKFLCYSHLVSCISILLSSDTTSGSYRAGSPFKLSATIVTRFGFINPLLLLTEFHVIDNDKIVQYAIV